MPHGEELKKLWNYPLFHSGRWDHKLEELSQVMMNTLATVTWERKVIVKVVVSVIELGKGPKSYSV